VAVRSSEDAPEHAPISPVRIPHVKKLLILAVLIGLGVLAARRLREA
jgi:hypothetical protein